MRNRRPREARRSSSTAWTHGDLQEDARQGDPVPHLDNIRYASGLESPQTAVTMLAGKGPDVADRNRRIIFVDGARFPLVRVVRHDAVIFRVRDGRDGRHED